MAKHRTIGGVRVNFDDNLTAQINGVAVTFFTSFQFLLFPTI